MEQCSWGVSGVELLVRVGVSPLLLLMGRGVCGQHRAGRCGPILSKFSSGGFCVPRVAHRVTASRKRDVRGPVGGAGMAGCGPSLSEDRSPCSPVRPQRSWRALFNLAWALAGDCKNTRESKGRNRVCQREVCTWLRDGGPVAGPGWRAREGGEFVPVGPR